MVRVATKFPTAIASQMAGNDLEITAWLQGATFAETSTGHWLAWHEDQPERLAVLSPRSEGTENRHWMYLGEGETLDVAITRVESGEFDEAEVSELNLYIGESTTNRLLPLQDYADVETATAYLQGIVCGKIDLSDPDQTLERFTLIYELYGEGELKELFAQAANAYSRYALQVTAHLWPAG